MSVLKNLSRSAADTSMRAILPMMADPHLSKTQVQQKLLRLIHNLEFIAGYLLPIRKSRCQAGKGRLLPGRQIHFF